MVNTIVFPSSFFDIHKVDEDLQEEYEAAMAAFQGCRTGRITERSGLCVRENGRRCSGTICRYIVRFCYSVLMLSIIVWNSSSASSP